MSSARWCIFGDKRIEDYRKLSHLTWKCLRYDKGKIKRGVDEKNVKNNGKDGRSNIMKRIKKFKKRKRKKKQAIRTYTAVRLNDHENHE